jgi:hypothetical protein
MNTEHIFTYQEVYAESEKGERLFKGIRIMLGDRELARGGNPMGDACRLLISEGHAPTEEVQAYWEGSTTPIFAPRTQLRRFEDWVTKEGTRDPPTYQTEVFDHGNTNFRAQSAVENSATDWAVRS